MNKKIIKDFLKQHLISDKNYFVVSKDTVGLIGGGFLIIYAIKLTSPILKLLENIKGNFGVYLFAQVIGVFFMFVFGITMVTSSFGDEEKEIEG